MSRGERVQTIDAVVRVVMDTALELPRPGTRHAQSAGFAQLSNKTA